MSNIYEKLLIIQTQLKAPKGQFNGFGKYKYRSCEDILEGTKPLLEKTLTCIIIKDDLVQIGDRYYVKATVRLQDTESDAFMESVAFAREEESKKGMDGSQVTGASSSYARKYALNGLFAIDDNKDSDTTNIGANKEDKQEVAEKEDIKVKLGKMIMDLADSDKAKAKELFKAYTSFKGKDGNTVEGKDKMDGMSDKAIQTTYGKVKIDWLKLNK